MPQGSHRSVTHFGPAGMGINADSSQAKQRAAWKFITFATSQRAQLAGLKNAGGSLTRRSTWNSEDVQNSVNESPGEAGIPNVAMPLTTMWQPQNMGMRPHTQHWNSLNEALFTGISQAINGEMEPQEAMEQIDSNWNDILSG
jgi:multiple sugar transport system substrate-binding protein